MRNAGGNAPDWTSRMCELNICALSSSIVYTIQLYVFIVFQVEIIPNKQQKKSHSPSVGLPTIRGKNIRDGGRGREKNRLIHLLMRDFEARQHRRGVTRP